MCFMQLAYYVGSIKNLHSMNRATRSRSSKIPPSACIFKVPTMPYFWKFLAFRSKLPHSALLLLIAEGSFLLPRD
jgi:hypothetical protein